MECNCESTVSHKQHLEPSSSLSVWSWRGLNGVNTPNRQLEGFNEQKGGLFWGVLWQQALAQSGAGNSMKVGTVGSGVFGKCAITYGSGVLRGTINFHFWENHSTLLGFVESVSVKNKKYLMSAECKCFHFQFSSELDTVTRTAILG